jgi:hypothetical protein
MHLSQLALCSAGDGTAGDLRALRLCHCGERLLVFAVHGGDLGELIAADQTDSNCPLAGESLSQRGHLGVVDLPLGDLARSCELGLLLQGAR